MKKFSIILWKEWMALRPFAVLLLAIFVIGLFVVQLSEFIDEYDVFEESYREGATTSGVYFVFCIIVSLGLLVREKDEKTLLYLDGLPVSRASIYIAKWIIAVTLMICFNVLFFIEGLAYEWLSRTSTSVTTPLRSHFVFLSLNAFLCGFFISVLLALSFLRRWSLLLIGLIFCLVYWLTKLQVPYIEYLNPFSLIQPPLEVTDMWQIPWKHLGILASIGIAAWIFGLLLFTSRMSSFRTFMGDFAESWVAKTSGGCAIFLIVVVWVVVLAFVFDEEEAESTQPAIVKREAKNKPGLEVLTEDTKHFQFVYRKRDQKKVAALMKDSDEAFVTVADALKAPESSRAERITVDLTSPLGSHNAGQAYWKKIRMTLQETPEESLAVLGHEIAHVVIDQITDGRLEDSFSSSRWFHEGLASWIEYQYFREDDAAVEYNRWLALASTWGEVHFDELVEDAVLTELRDSYLVYPAGMKFIESLVAVYGEEAPSQLLTALGRPDGPRKLSGLSLWRDATTAADFDLERIRTRFRKDLRDLREDYKEVCRLYPEFTEASATRREGKIVITPVLPENWKKDLPKGATLFCRMKPQTDSAPASWRYSNLKKDGTFQSSAINFLKPEMHYQIGWKTGEWARQPIFGEWVATTIANE